MDPDAALDFDDEITAIHTPGLAPLSFADQALPLELIPAVVTLYRLTVDRPGLLRASLRTCLETLLADLDTALSRQVNGILHHREFQTIEAAWRGLNFLVRQTETTASLKIRVLDITKRELSRTLRKFRGTAWDQSPLFRKLYDEEYGQFGGEPYGVVIGDFHVDHHPEDVQLLADMAKIAAAAHFPFVAGAAPSVMQMESWSELANPRDLTRIFQTPEYTAWRAMRSDEDTRYIGLCMPHCLARLPYGADGDPLDEWAFEEVTDGPDASRFLWINAAYAFASNIARAFTLYGWCTRIRGVDTGGRVDGLIAHTFSSADGDMDRRCITEVSLSERRETELSRAGFIPLLHRKNTDHAVFVSAQSLQLPATYADAEATANAVLSSRLPYLLACCRFAQYLKCMVRDKVGSSLSQTQLQQWLLDWLMGYVDGSPATSSDEWKAAHPLAGADVVVEPREGEPGQYEARFFLRPHYQLEGMSVSLRLMSRLTG